MNYVRSLSGVLLAGLGACVAANGVGEHPRSREFPAPPSDFSVVRQAEDLLVAFVASDEGPADIETGDKALRLFFHFEPADPGNYRFEFDLQTVFASQDVQPIPLVFENSLTIPWIPEPAALALLAPAAVFAVRPARSRRRSCGDLRKI